MMLGIILFHAYCESVASDVAVIFYHCNWR